MCDSLGKAYEGGEALRMLARNVPGLTLLDWAYGLPGVYSVAGGVYHRVNWMGKRLCLSCGEQWMPSKKYSERKNGQEGGGLGQCSYLALDRERV